MSEISELEARLSAALDRIARTVQYRPTPSEEIQTLTAELDRLSGQVTALKAEGADRAAEIERLKQALDDEALVAKQHKARTDALHGKLAEAEAEVARLKTELAARDALTAQFRRVNGQLRQNNLSLRDANTRGHPDPHLINKAMLTELESIRASREAERAEIDAVLAELKPLVGENADA